MFGIAKVINTDSGQLVHLPDGFRFDTPIVSVRRAGKAVILDPIKLSEWPEGFFESIRIDDPAFIRPPQGEFARRDW